MTYYRVALQKDQSSTWMSKSTVLVSLNAVFGFIKLHHMVPRDRLRVFFSSSVEYLNEMLDRENQGLLSNSLTVEQLLNGRGCIDQLEMQLFESACDLHQYMGTAMVSLLTAHLWQLFESACSRRGENKRAGDETLSSRDERKRRPRHSLPLQLASLPATTSRLDEAACQSTARRARAVGRGREKLEEQRVHSVHFNVIMLAVWSFMLAARKSLESVLHWDKW